MTKPKKKTKSKTKGVPNKNVKLKRKKNDVKPTWITSYRGAMIATYQFPVPLIQTNIQALGSWNANLIRWPLINNPQVDPPWTPAQYQAWLEEALAAMDSCMTTLQSCGISVVLDMHHPIGGVDKSGHWRLFNDSELQDLFVQYWVEIATRYASNPTVIAYDLFNEPQPYSADQWWTLATRTATAIRAVDRCKPLIIETIGGDPRGFGKLVPLATSLDPIWYSAHIYFPKYICFQGVVLSGSTPEFPIGAPYTNDGLAKLKQVIAPMEKFQATYCKPIYIGEFGCARWSGYSGKENRVPWFSDCIKIFENNGWNWSYHAFREWQGWDIELPFDPNDFAPSQTSTVVLMKKAFNKNC